MAMTRDDLQVKLNCLYLQVRRLLRENPDPADFWPEFAGRADEILDQAGPSEYDWVAGQIDAMLEDNGLRAHQLST
ncbi:hypothetical protein [Dyella humicola]|uniref:hypothetical protein n=1 Tax=Dyella humicola TaxID=2992126 RepID=UPI00224F1233|nr:hypothetical protein [Dyella humicola]